MSVRFYSSDNRKSQNVLDGEAEKESSRQDQPSSLASAFGFQSLSGLFVEPKQRRYSRPRQPRAEPPKPGFKTQEKRDVAMAEDSAVTRDAVLDPATPFRSEKAMSPAVQEEAPSYEEHQCLQEQFQSKSMADTPNLSQRHPVETHAVKGVTKPSVQEEGSPYGAYQSLQPPNQPQLRAGRRSTFRKMIGHNVETDSATRRQRLMLLRKGQSHLSLQNQTMKRPNPFTTDCSGVPSNGKSGNLITRLAFHDTQEEGSAQPWGLSKTEGKSPDAITNHPYAAAITNDGGEDGIETSTPPVGSSAAVETPEETISSGSPPTSTKSVNTLTHLTSAGEAHMVDISAKTETKRVAIAMSMLRFSRIETFDAVAENSNKKGDVLGVARIAGIMAAKRASDIIPLCHPLMISKVELEVRIISPNSSMPAIGFVKNGGISTTAEVHCTGPTGVEMEALTAVTAAGLTAYDMCKAIDKYMIMSNSRVLYKAGGKSGMHLHRDWARSKGSAWFQERNYDVPAILGPDAPPATNQQLDKKQRPGRWARR